MRIHLSIVALLTSYLPWPALSQDIQLTLKSEHSVYTLGQAVRLSYEVLWLGENDGQVFENSLEFPVLEIAYLNRFPVEIVHLGSFEVRAEPSRHERATFAPTMRFESKAFQINSREGVRFLDGRVGYYDFEKTGTYVIRAVFRESFNWKLYHGQHEDISSNAIVIEIVP
jgi:hypothetical protein